MNIKLGDLLTLDDGRYVTLDNIEYKNEKYIFTDKVDDNDKPMNDTCVFKIVGDVLEIIDDKDLLDTLMPIFLKDIEKLVQDL